MRLVKLSAGPFFTYAKMERELPSGVTLVLGENGAGKSAGAYEALCFALYGETVRGSKVREATVEATVDVGGELYTVKRSRTSRGTKLDLRCGILELSGATPTETQAKIERLVGTYERWCAGHVFARDLLAKFGLATDKERKALLEEVLGLQQFDRALKLAKEAYAEAGAERAGHDARIPLLGSRLKELGERRDELAARQPRQPDSIQVEIMQVEHAHKEAKAKAAPITERLDEVQGEVGAATVARMRAERDNEANRGARQDIARELEAVREACAACGRPFDKASLLESRARLQVQLEDLKGAEPPRTLALAKARSLEAVLNEEFGELQDANRAHLQAQEARRLRHAALKLELVSAEAAQGDIEALDAKIRDAQTDLSVANVSRSNAAHKQDVAKHCVEALGLKGARNLLLSRALGSIEREANGVLARLMPGVRVRLTGTVVQGDGREVDKVGLDVDGAGGGEYRGCSGGQRVRIDIAMLLALASLGPQDGLLVFDEVFDSLDRQWVERVAEHLTELSRTRQVVVITHNDDFASMFPRATVWRARLGESDFSELVDE
jgi:DNA repair exonuclease SbcCD ATPase subunit